MRLFMEPNELFESNTRFCFFSKDFLIRKTSDYIYKTITTTQKHV